MSVGRKIDLTGIADALPNDITGWASLISGVGAMASWVACGILRLVGIDPAAIGVKWFPLFCVLAFASLLALLVGSYRRRLLILSSFSGGLYAIMHGLRDAHYALHKLKKDDSGPMTQASIDGVVMQYLKEVLDTLSSIFGACTGKKVSACIKDILPEEDSGRSEEVNPSVARVRTLMRSGNSDGPRNSADALSRNGDLISENTDFSKILSCDKNNAANTLYFYQGNLRKYDKALKKLGERGYENSNENYWDYYRGTIVVPIRAKHEKLFFTKRTDCYDTLGFLCVDSMSTRAFPKRREKVYAYLLKAVAADLYLLLAQYKYYSEEVFRASLLSESDEIG